MSAPAEPPHDLLGHSVILMQFQHLSPSLLLPWLHFFLSEKTDLPVLTVEFCRVCIYYQLTMINYP